MEGVVGADTSPWRPEGSLAETNIVYKQLQQVKPHQDSGVPHDVPDGLPARLQV